MRGLIADLFKEFMGPLGLSAPVAALKTVSLPELLETVSAPIRHTARMPPKKVMASTVHKPTGKTRCGVAALLPEPGTSDCDTDSKGLSSSSSSTDADHMLSAYAARATQRLVSMCSYFSVQHCHFLQKPLVQQCLHLLQGTQLVRFPTGGPVGRC